ncbi:stage II sporulation protein P [Alkaliphilus sp. MSJ-5]|uniref:Stage II sporulation protein P n=1 Tax=Alkaliphilus flagellatus TaxID=2841507 RepID=A0ABS6G494_9FIRM|nr:stage II sporulation protein P [Alkaliphilus flagellatus]MBU5677315.1 stage II sporulation protein P [Alkaliphilus flagellatus]
MKKSRLFCILLVLITLMTQIAVADDWYSKEAGYYKVYDSNTNKLLFKTAREVTKNDQYLSGDNKMYKVTKVNKKTNIAYAKFVEDISLPEIDEEAFANIKLALDQKIDISAILTQAEQGDKSKRKVGIYASHTAESYEPSDGTESIVGAGGVLKVAEKLKEGFEGNGVNAIFDNTSHDPHDAGAYKRSRRTALQLIRQQQPTALVDVHRDAVPAEEYLTEINGDPASKVRLVVGRRNQNFKANEEMAMKVKAVADKMHPGLIKDIFYAKGDYNQDLTPRAMLLEMGTYKHTRERAEKSAGYMSEVITTALFGGTFKDERTNAVKEVKPSQSTGQSNKGSGAGILGVLAVIVIGGAGFMFLSSGGTEWKSKISNFGQEFTNFLGRSKKKK